MNRCCDRTWCPGAVEQDGSTIRTNKGKTPMLQFGKRRRAGAIMTLAVLCCTAAWSQTAQAEGDATAGKKRYQMTCLGCHGDDRMAPTTGPSLVNIIGRKAGSAASGVISRAAAESGIVWDEQNLDQFLASPSEKIHGTIMPIGVRNPKERADLIAYLSTLKK
jgi:cytochrome c